jgi:sugar fermentation stimulation protein A
MIGCDEPDSEAWYSESENPKRKYRHTLEVVVTDRGRIGINTSRANALVREALQRGALEEFSGFEFERNEVAIPDEKGRFDLLLRECKTGRACFVEVKNMTLCDPDGRGSFPDAVSERALKHILALERRVRAGDRGVLVFCVQHTGIARATIADEIHPAYGCAVRAAAETGVEVFAFRCRIERDEISIERAIPVDLSDQRTLSRNLASVS